MPLYRRFSSANEINKEYNVVLGIEDLDTIIALDKLRGEETRQRLIHIDNIPYGSCPEQTLDIFPAEQSHAPVLIFIHGGYWKSMVSQNFSFIANGLVKLGYTVVLTNYTLCPKATIPQITLQSTEALEWIYHNCSYYNGNPDKIIVAGHSAGAQQAAMLTLQCKEGSDSIPLNTIKGCIGISGIYDLTPLMHSWLQPDLRLNQRTLELQSPLLQQNINCAPSLLIVGGEESAEFKRQTQDYTEKLTNHGNTAQLYTVPNRNHFTVIQDLYDCRSETCRAIERFIHSLP